MTYFLNKNLLLALLCCASFAASAQDTVRYVGNTLVNVDYHHGQLRPAVGVHNTQLFRANRQHPEKAEGVGWTYNHAPMLAYWNNQFFVEYLSDSVGESVPPGHTLLSTSKDGNRWTRPEVIFPAYRIPDGTTKEGQTLVAKGLDAVMHQRMGFYVSKKNRLLILGYYGICLDEHDDPNDGNGIGRVVREMGKDGKPGPIYFIHYNHRWNPKNTSYPFYTTAPDKGFVEACNELLATPLMVQQWVEESDRDDPLITLKKEVKALSFYHLPDGRAVALWKNALTTMSKDEGKTWLYNPTRAPGFVNSNAKIWGQRTSDGHYATVYNPSEFRWPLAVSTSADGLNYSNLWLVNGEITTMRYGGNYKSYGPQYVRGIEEGNGTPPDKKLWVTYSMNKEDIWVASVPVPVTDKATAQAADDFDKLPAGQELEKWNYNSGLWTPVAIEKGSDGARALVLRDRDPFDYARAERVIPESKVLVAELVITPQQADRGLLDIEFQDGKGTAGVRLSFDSTGNFVTKAGYRYRNIMKYQAGEQYRVQVELNTAARFYTVTVNDKKVLPGGIFFAPLHSIERIVLRTGTIRRFPDADSPTDQMYDLPNGGEETREAAYSIKSLKTH
ncbi:MAG: six-hairpin glycosidase [Williamsia sp.]|nr:six-hairpin glycosidase [Williamsia sp.]